MTWLARHRRRITQIGTGHLIYGAFNWLFDNVFYVYVVYTFGLLAGGGMMTAFSLAQCMITLLIYERMKIDWVGAGAVLQLLDVPRPSWWRRAANASTRRGKAAAFVGCCVFSDPFITTAYFRKGRFDGLTQRDWQIFFGSVVVSNFYWTLRSGLVAQLIATGWEWLTK